MKEASSLKSFNTKLNKFAFMGSCNLSRMVSHPQFNFLLIAYFYAYIALLVSNVKDLYKLFIYPNNLLIPYICVKE